MNLDETPRKYGALRTIAVLVEALAVTGFLVMTLATGLTFTVTGFLISASGQTFTLGYLPLLPLAIGLLILGMGTMFGLLVFAIGESIDVVVDIERNTRAAVIRPARVPTTATPAFNHPRKGNRRPFAARKQAGGVHSDEWSGAREVVAQLAVYPRPGVATTQVVEGTLRAADDGLETVDTKQIATLRGS